MLMLHTGLHNVAILQNTVLEKEGSVTSPNGMTIVVPRGDGQPELRRSSATIWPKQAGEACLEPIQY